VKFNVNLWSRLSASLLIAAVLVGCAARRHAEPGITMHIWRQLTWEPAKSWEGPTSAMYTYVLVGDGASRGGTVDADRARSALKALLREVQLTEGVSNNDPQYTDAVQRQMNQFAVPTNKGVDPTADIALAQYDFKLAQSYRRVFQVIAAKDPKLDEEVLNGSGPYLVATRKPLALLISEQPGGHTVIDESPVLVMDMSKGSEASVPYYVAAFKEAVRVARPDSTALLPMKPTIVEFLTKVDRSIPLLEEIWSQSRKRFEEKKA